MRTISVRIEYELAQPTSGLAFWGAYAQTDGQVAAHPLPLLHFRGRTRVMSALNTWSMASSLPIPQQAAGQSCA